MTTHKNQVGQDGTGINGGEFARKTQSDAPVGLLERDTVDDYQKVVDAIEAADETYTLVYTEYDDGLTDEQIGWYLSGDLSELEDSLSEVFDDARERAAREEATRICEENGVDFEDLDWGEQTEILGHIKDRDDSDIAGQLVNSTRDKLMRANLFSVTDLPGYNKLYMNSTDEVFDGRVAALSTALTDRGVDVSSDEAQKAIRGLVSEGPYYWHEAVDVDVIWYGAIGDATAGPHGHVDGVQANARTLTFAKPNIVIMDRASGSGWEAELPAPVSVTVTQDKPAFLDNDKSKGWGWDATAGVVHSAYRTDVTAQWARV